MISQNAANAQAEIIATGAAVEIAELLASGGGPEIMEFIDGIHRQAVSTIAALRKTVGGGVASFRDAILNEADVRTGATTWAEIAGTNNTSDGGGGGGGTSDTAKWGRTANRGW